MMLRYLIKNNTGATAVEFGLTAPVFFLMLISLIELGLVFWTQIGLQHGTEMAARCASVNRSICGSSLAVQNYAARQSLGLNPPISTFSIDVLSCGNQVTANYDFMAIAAQFGLPSLTLKAKACFPR
jgi:Flp pilus assembly protein TadG